MRLPLALALLALCCGCGDRPAKSDAGGPDTSHPSNSVTNDPPDSALPAPAPAAPPDSAAPPQSDRFIVCPGDQRCPKGKDGRPSGDPH